MDVIRKRAEEAEERGRYRESKGSYVFAMISYANAKQLYEEAGDTENLRVVKNCIERVKNILKQEDEIKLKEYIIK